MNGFSSFLFCTLLLLLQPWTHAAEQNSKMAFWQSAPRQGANCFNIHVDEDWFKAAKAAGFGWVRLTWDKWQGQGRDFLAGDLDHYQSLQQEDLTKLKAVLDMAAKYQLPVVLVPLGLPGARWVQNNRDIPDERLWSSQKFQHQAAQFWLDIARTLKGHSAVVGYSLLSEPRLADSKVWSEISRQLVASVRNVDPDMPVIIESSDFGNPAGWKNHLPINDPNTLYAVRFMKPWAYSSRFNFVEKRRLRYPGEIKSETGSEYWDRSRLELELASFTDWAETHKIPVYRLMISAFGGFRRNPDMEHYLRDVFSILNKNKLHWAFYAFREDAWDGYDLECGAEGFGEKWWQAHKSGNPLPRPRKPNRLWQVVTEALKGK